MKVALDGSGLTKIASTQNVSPQGIAVDRSNVYWVHGDAIMRAPVAGGTPMNVASGQAQPNAVVVDDARVYWTNFGGSLLSLPKP